MDAQPVYFTIEHLYAEDEYRAVYRRVTRDGEPREIPRACLQCDHLFVGDIYCPECDQPSGEPIQPIEQDAD